MWMLKVLIHDVFDSSDVWSAFISIRWCMKFGFLSLIFTISIFITSWKISLTSETIPLGPAEEGFKDVRKVSELRSGRVPRPLTAIKTLVKLSACDVDIMVRILDDKATRQPWLSKKICYGSDVGYMRSSWFAFSCNYGSIPRNADKCGFMHRTGFVDFRRAWVDLAWHSSHAWGRRSCCTL